MKAHSQFELALACMHESLHCYGHLQPGIFYTDIVTDWPFLERSFPSLKEGVISVDKYSSLEAFELPDEFCGHIFVKNMLPAINDAICTILEDVPENEGFVVVGFDSEWNVELTAEGRVQHCGQTAVIQIAYQSRVYILQVGMEMAWMM